MCFGVAGVDDIKEEFAAPSTRARTCSVVSQMRLENRNVSTPKSKNSSDEISEMLAENSNFYSSVSECGQFLQIRRNFYTAEAVFYVFYFIFFSAGFTPSPHSKRSKNIRLSDQVLFTLSSVNKYLIYQMQILYFHTIALHDFLNLTYINIIFFHSIPNINTFYKCFN